MAPVDAAASGIVRPDRTRAGAGDASGNVGRMAHWDVSYVVFQGDTMEPMAPVVARLRGT